MLKCAPMVRSLLLLTLVLCPFFAFTHGDHDHHNHENSPGGPLLQGYPWGLFPVDVSFDKRVEHKRNDQELVLANKIFEYIAQGYDVAFPINLNHQGSFNPFGDGQTNSEGNFSDFKKAEVPVMALLNRNASKLKVVFSSSLVSSGQKVKLRWPQNITTEYTLNDQLEIELSLDISALNWDTHFAGQVLYLQPENENGWYPIKFQVQNIPVSELAAGVANSLRFGDIPNPLEADQDLETPPLLQIMEKAKAADSKYNVYTTDKVHSIFPNANDPNFAHKSSGGNWTFLLKQEYWEGPNKRTFKQLYSCFQGRATWEESIRKSVSGTSWHHVGDPGEIILNSIKNEDRELITAIGVKINPPAGMTLAKGLTHVGFAAKTIPGYAFISVQNQYHWHPVHTTLPVCVEVWTPDCVPAEDNGYGFNCH